MTSVVVLRDVCEILKGGINPQQTPEREFAHYSIPAFDSGMRPAIERGEQIRSQKTRVKKGAVLVSKLNPRIPRVWFIADDCNLVRVSSTEFVPLLPDANCLLPEYLAFGLRYSLAIGRISGTTSAATKSRERAKPSDFAALALPLPSLIEQRRIVDLLSRAESIVRLRREAQRKSAELIPAIFLDMFGDPASNPKRWPIVPLGDLVERFEGGKNIQAGHEGASDLRVLKISAVTSGHYVESESKPVPADFVPQPSYFVRPGDLLFSRANTEALVGATALVEATDGQTLLPDKLWRFVWRNDVEIASAFMLHFLQQPVTRKQLSQLASGTGGSMKNISQAKLKTLPVTIPPIDLQRQFVAKVEAARGIIARQTAAIGTAQANFDALLHRAFAAS